jgi:hypothetical protein
MTKRIIPFLVLFLCLTSSALAQPYSTAQEVLQANIDKTGGERWSTIETMKTELQVVIESPQGLIMMQGETARIFPGYMFMEVTSEDMPMANQTIYMTPEGGWMNAQGSMEELSDTSEAAQNMMRPFKEEMSLLEEEEVGGLALLDSDTLDDREVYVVQVGGETGPKRYYDKENLYLVGVEVPNPMGGDNIMQMSGDYKEISGLLIPHEQTVDMSAMGMTQTVILTNVAINTPLTPEELKEKAEAAKQQ